VNVTVLATGELYGGARSCVNDLVALLCTQRPISGCTDNFRSALSVRQHKYNALSRPFTDGQSVFSLHAPARGYARFAIAQSASTIHVACVHANHR